jgi:hypothetical protein
MNSADIICSQDHICSSHEIDLRKTQLIKFDEYNPKFDFSYSADSESDIDSGYGSDSEYYEYELDNNNVDIVSEMIYQMFGMNTNIHCDQPEFQVSDDLIHYIYILVVHKFRLNEQYVGIQIDYKLMRLIYDRAVFEYEMNIPHVNFKEFRDNIYNSAVAIFKKCGRKNDRYQPYIELNNSLKHYICNLVFHNFGINVTHDCYIYHIYYLAVTKCGGNECGIKLNKYFIDNLHYAIKNVFERYLNLNHNELNKSDESEENDI